MLLQRSEAVWGSAGVYLNQYLTSNADSGSNAGQVSTQPHPHSAEPPRGAASRSPSPNE